MAAQYIEELQQGDWGADSLIAIVNAADDSDKEHLMAALHSKVGQVTEEAMKQLDAEFGQRFYGGADFRGYLWYIDDTMTMCVASGNDVPGIILWDPVHWGAGAVLWGQYDPVPVDRRFRIENVRGLITMYERLQN